jgi:hypothetical protein
MSGDLATIIFNAIPEWQPGAKKGDSVVHPEVLLALTQAGYDVDNKDSRCFLQKRMPAWQRCSNGGYNVECPIGRLQIDLVVYDRSDLSIPVALVEVESDLADMGTKGDYTVASIAKDAEGQPFDGYKSVERMAAAVQFRAMEEAIGHYPTPLEGLQRLQAIRSDDLTEHNPVGMSLFLACYKAERKRVQLLQRRLDSLGVQLLGNFID